MNTMFYTRRNIKECLFEGVKLFCNNTSSLIRLFWAILLVCSLLVTATIILSVTQTSEPSNPSTTIQIAYIAMLLLSLFASCVFQTAILTAVHLKSSSYDLSKVTLSFFYKEMKKHLCYMSVWYIITVLLLMLFSFIPSTYNVIVILLFSWFTALVTPSLVFSGKTFVRSVRYALRLGITYNMKVLGLVLLLSVTVGILILITSTPLLLSTVMLQTAWQAYLSGDILKASIFVISHPSIIISVMLFSTFVTLFIQIMYYFPLTYLYSSIVVSYEEKITNSGEDKD